MDDNIYLIRCFVKNVVLLLQFFLNINVRYKTTNHTVHVTLTLEISVQFPFKWNPIKLQVMA